MNSWLLFFSNLFSQRIQMKETVADAFISRFQLKPEEAQALKGTKNGPISEVLIKLFLCCSSFIKNVIYSKYSVMLTIKNLILWEV